MVWGDGDFLLVLRREHDAPKGEYTLRVLNERALLKEIDAAGIPPATRSAGRERAGR